MDIEEYNQENWRPVTGFSGYEVSDRGRVRSYKKRIEGNTKWIIAGSPQRILRPSTSRYRRVVLLRHGKCHTKSVAGLVMEAFIGPRPKGMEICHTDCNRCNVIASTIYGMTPRKIMLPME